MITNTGPLINKLSGIFAKEWVFRTRRDGKIVIARRSRGMGAEADHPSIKYMQTCWNALDLYWKTLTPADKIEWGKCTPPHHTAFLHYKATNLRRFLAGHNALPRPPDMFQSHNADVVLKEGKTVRIAVEGITKPPGDPFPPGPGPEPPPGNPCIIIPPVPTCPDQCEACTEWIGVTDDWEHLAGCGFPHGGTSYKLRDERYPDPEDGWIYPCDWYDNGQIYHDWCDEWDHSVETVCVYCHEGCWELHLLCALLHYPTWEWWTSEAFCWNETGLDCPPAEYWFMYQQCDFMPWRDAYTIHEAEDPGA